MNLSAFCVDEHRQAQEIMDVGAVQAAPAFCSPLPSLRVFPVKNKRPLSRGWQHSAPIDLKLVAGWQEKHLGCNWGAALDSDTMVIDCDSDAALSALCDIAESHGGIPSTLTTITGRGFHFWFRTPVPVHNRVAVMPGVDVRTKGGFVVIPPSVHQNGTPYQFAWSDAPVADAPEWLLRLVTGAASGARKSNAHSAPTGSTTPELLEGLTPFERDIARCGWERRRAPGKVPDGRSPFALLIALQPHKVIKGIRNGALYAYLCRLRHEGKAEEAIRVEARRVAARIPEPLSRYEVERVIANALKFDAGAIGTNTLVQAWRTVEQIDTGPGMTRWYRFLLLVEQLAETRPMSKPTILLPVRSIGILMNAHHTQVAKWRRRAVEMGILSNTSRYVRRRLADEFTVKAGFSPLTDGPALYKVKRGRKPRTKPIELEQGV